MPRNPPPKKPTGSDRRAPDPRAARRVAEVHAQTRQGLLVAAAFVAAAVVAALLRPADGWWLPLHLFVVGGLLSAISAAAPMLAVTWSASPAPPSAVAAAQRWTLVAGAVALTVGRQTDRTWLFVTGGIAVLVAVLALVPILLRIRQQATTRRYWPAIEAYVAAALAGAAGTTLGITLGGGWAGSRLLELRGAHLLLNVEGMVGLVIAGTLPFFAATQVRRKTSPLATPLVLRVVFAWLALATVLAAVAQAVDRSALVATGLGAYALGLVAVGAVLPVYGQGALRWAGPRIVQLLAGLAWWTAMTVALAVARVRAWEDQRILQALVIGGFAQILVASLAYLGPVLRGRGHERLTAGFDLTRSWLSLVAGNVGAAAALAGAHVVTATALLVWLADGVVRAVLLLTNRSAPAARSSAS